MTSDTIPIRKGEELDLKKIESFLRDQVEGLPEETLTVEQFSAGRSNLTYQLNMGEWEAVLRRPPLGPVAPKAHDMEREFTILQEIHPFFPPAPKPIVFGNEDLIGAPFFIMERKKGVVIDTEFPEGIKPTKELGKLISYNMVDTLVNLHQIDYKATKLTEMTKPEGFLERQVHGWIKRYERSKTEEIYGLDELTKWMTGHIPHSQEPSIIHYDFKLNNSMFNSDFTKLVGLFDWEMTTVGDPLADLGCALSYWTEANDSDLLKKGLGDAPITALPGFITRQEFIAAYAEKSGRDVSNIHFYLTFAYFKLAVICQQIYYRWKKGQTVDERFAELNVYVNNLIQYALETSRKRQD
ncbi:phosphotransferase family protein [Cytobacillus purgationiresistens]|uniref:Aminoglycoside phosphotransferase (APT) family kinase protein n=1 Tax=Cytobacillus purgationiresistens TaxID=863449 RepID=A0ABU0AEU4_9BACI|nr:phosphotransferase family protein [Cytobacillus purgationiresistens]MDQ0269776.1 aminoglycoside phosphotransferase (APT) family kinase protein [Cytobacillus purgationiresistens]